MNYVILRDDDTCALTKPEHLERLYRPFLQAGLPVNLATIPNVRLDVRLPDGSPEGFLLGQRPTAGGTRPLAGNPELLAYLRANPGYRLVFHGFQHEYFEFVRLSEAEVGRRLDAGAAAFREAGVAVPETFVAPYDQYDPRSLRVLSRRFQVFSTGWFNVGRLPWSWWPAYWRKRQRGDAHWQRDGLRLLSHPGCLLSYHRDYGRMLANVQAAVRQRRVTVLVTHWWEYYRDGRPDDAFIAVLHAVADFLKQEPDVKVIAFSELAAGTLPEDWCTTLAAETTSAL